MRGDLIMDLEKLLEVIQVQRHDFLNHLQVISGFLQLNRFEQAQVYIKEISREMAVSSKISRIKNPEVTAALLTGLNEASKYQIMLDVAVDSSLADCAVPGSVLGMALENCFSSFFEVLSPPHIKDKILEVLFAQSDNIYTCRLFSQFSQISDQGRFEQSLAQAGELLARYGGQAKAAFKDGGVEIFFILPRREAKIG
jgi:sensor histidine kinase regulating citrate/malate metabolism